MGYVVCVFVFIPCVHTPSIRGGGPLCIIITHTAEVNGSVPPILASAEAELYRRHNL